MQLKFGFSRLDITPPMGVFVEGYYEPRNANGVLDPLYVNALAASDGANTFILLCVDVIGIEQTMAAEMRAGVAEACGISPDSVIITCTHTHTGPVIGGKLFPFDPVYNARLGALLAQASRLAYDDMLPGEMYGASGEALGISFIRRFRMKDGSIRTNPGRRNPDVVEPIGQADESLRIVKIAREGANDLLLVNFQVHPDVVNGSKLSADYPGFVIRTLEGALPGVSVIYYNAAAGNLNHIDVNAPEWDANGGYPQACHMGRVIAGAVLGLYTKARPIASGPVKAVVVDMVVPLNKADPSLLPQAANYVKWHNEGRDDLIPEHGMGITTLVAEATRMLKLADGPDDKALKLSAAKVGGLSFAAIPGEGFCEIGRQVREESPFEMQFVLGLANGNEGYYPMIDSFTEGGYEARSSSFKPGIGEKIADTLSEIVKTL